MVTRFTPQLWQHSNWLSCKESWGDFCDLFEMGVVIGIDCLGFHEAIFLLSIDVAGLWWVLGSRGFDPL